MPASEQGVTFERYMLVPRTLVFLTTGDKILLLKGASNKRLWAGLYNGIGGHVEQGEDVLSAAWREIGEETGITPLNLWLCGIITVDTQTNPGVVIFIYRGECLESTIHSSIEGSFEWHQRDEISNLPLVADLPLLLPRILVHSSDQPPIIAHSSYDQTGNMVIDFI